MQGFGKASAKLSAPPEFLALDTACTVQGTTCMMPMQNSSSQVDYWELKAWISSLNTSETISLVAAHPPTRVHYS
jgi:hypothetical protein